MLSESFTRDCLIARDINELFFSCKDIGKFFPKLFCVSKDCTNALLGHVGGLREKG